MKIERWRTVPGFEGKYEVSDFGRVRSLSYKGGTKTMILSLARTRDGYLRARLNKNSKTYHRLVSRLVYEAFVGPIPEGMQVNHINEDKTDNRLENLNLMTPKENNNWGTHNERMKKALSRPVSQYDRDGKLIKRYKSLKSAVEKTGYSKGYLSDCCKGRFKICHGYMWKYAQTGQTQ